MSCSIQGTSQTPTLVVGNKIIGAEHPVFFIAEIGQNHQGDIEVAKKLIDEAKKYGADCVKFQKTNIKEKFTRQVLERPYVNPNSWGRTYGEHKQFLEFSDDEFRELQSYASDKDILFTASAMDIVSFKFLQTVNVPFIKIGSGDANNFQLLKEAAKYKGPLVISTGMLGLEEVEKIYNLMKSNNKKNFALLHCVSSYPTPLEDINLNVINLYKEKFPDIVIGYSGHEIGIDVCITATVLGARIIERHITLNHEQKGSDHKCSLLPDQFGEMVEKIKNIQIALGSPKKSRAASELSCWEKLGKCIVAAKDLKQGCKIQEGDLKTKVTEPKGINGIFFEDLIGQELTRDLNTDTVIFPEYFK